MRTSLVIIMATVAAFAVVAGCATASTPPAAAPVSAPQPTSATTAIAPPSTQEPPTEEPTTTAIAPPLTEEPTTTQKPPPTEEPTTTLGPVESLVGVGDEPRSLEVEVISELTRAPDVFTQGLELVDDVIVESGGLYGQSRVRRVDPAEYVELATVDLPDEVFAEGLTLVGDVVYVLTWREGRVFVIDPATLDVLDELAIDGEGWGICALDDGTLVTSDGSDRLTIRSADLTPLSTVPVTRAGDPVARLNELECLGSTVWANVWLTDDIVAIDIASGAVQAVVDAAGLLVPPPAAEDSDAVLNGIAHLAGDEFLITGKLWPAAFVVRFVSAD